jgi:hypothetical protein
MRSESEGRSRNRLRPKGPAAFRFAACFLIFTAGCFLLFRGLASFANLSVTALLPGPRESVNVWWVFGLACVAGTAAAVAFEWNLRANVRRAAERAEAGDPIGAARQLDEVTGHGPEWAAAAVQSYLDERAAAPDRDVLPEEVRRLADAGEQLRAVERLRGLSGVGIEEAMRRVEAYRTRRAETAGPDAAPDPARG